MECHEIIYRRYLLGPHYVPGPVNIRAFIEGDMATFYNKFSKMTGEVVAEPHAAV